MIVPYSLSKVVLWCYFSNGAQQDSLHENLMARFPKGIFPNGDTLTHKKATQSWGKASHYHNAQADGL